MEAHKVVNGRGFSNVQIIGSQKTVRSPGSHVDRSSPTRRFVALNTFREIVEFQKHNTTVKFRLTGKCSVLKRSSCRAIWLVA